MRIFFNIPDFFVIFSKLVVFFVTISVLYSEKRWVGNSSYSVGKGGGRDIFKKQSTTGFEYCLNYTRLNCVHLILSYLGTFIFLLIWQVNCINFEWVYDLLIFNCDWTEIFDRVFLKGFLFFPGVWPMDHESPSLMMVAF